MGDTLMRLLHREPSPIEIKGKVSKEAIFDDVVDAAIVAGLQERFRGPMTRSFIGSVATWDIVNDVRSVEGVLALEVSRQGGAPQLSELNDPMSPGE